MLIRWVKKSIRVLTDSKTSLSEIHPESHDRSRCSRGSSWARERSPLKSKRHTGGMSYGTRPYCSGTHNMLNSQQDFLIDQKDFCEGPDWLGLNPTLPIYIWEVARVLWRSRWGGEGSLRHYNLQDEKHTHCSLDHLPIVDPWLSGIAEASTYPFDHTQLSRRVANWDRELSGARPSEDFARTLTR